MPPPVAGEQRFPDERRDKGAFVMRALVALHQTFRGEGVRRC